MKMKDVLQATSFRFNKALGQNFISDTNLLKGIVADSGVKEGDVVVEIGTGAGTLTRQIAEVAKKVYSFEVDKNLIPVHELSLQGLDNVDVIFRDVLKMKDDEFKSIVGDGEFKVVANLPYYITTPLIMRFLESDLKVTSLTIMVQEEVGRRLVAKPNTADYSAITTKNLNFIAKLYVPPRSERRFFMRAESTLQSLKLASDVIVLHVLPNQVVRD